MLREDIRIALLEKFVEASNEAAEFTTARNELIEFVRNTYKNSIPDNVQKLYTKWPEAIKTINDINTGEFADEETLILSKKYQISPPMICFHDDPYVKVGHPNIIKEKTFINKELTKELNIKVRNYLETLHSKNKLRASVCEVISLPYINSELLKKKIPGLL